LIGLIILLLLVGTGMVGIADELNGANSYDFGIEVSLFLTPPPMLGFEPAGLESALAVCPGTLLLRSTKLLST